MPEKEKMLDLLIKSKTRQKIIRLFLWNPKRDFNVAEIASAVQTKPERARQELLKLQEIDLVAMKKKGNLNIFSLNSDNYFLKEITGIMKKCFGIEDDIKQALEEIDGIVFAFLFGAYVKRHFKTKSDIELFIIGEVAKEKIQGAINPIKKFVGREINYRIASPKEFQAKKNEEPLKNILRCSLLILGEETKFKELSS
jgi:predicted nucleotidyltransferase